jgi:hypothetical protein
MTLEQFIATRREVDDLRREGCYGDNLERETPGFVYHDGLVIEKTPDGKFYLFIGNADWLSNDVSELERRLYDFAVREDYFN